MHRKHAPGKPVIPPPPIVGVTKPPPIGGVQKLPPIVIVILGHGADLSGPFTDIPYVIATPPSTYTFHDILPDLNFITTLSKLYGDNPGISLNDSIAKMEMFRDTFLHNGIVYDPNDVMDTRNPDPRGEETLWRATRLNLNICPHEGDIYNNPNPYKAFPCNTQDKLNHLKTYTPYGIYDVSSFKDFSLITQDNYDRGEINGVFLQSVQNSPGNISDGVYSILRGMGYPGMDKVVNHCGMNHYPCLSMKNVHLALQQMYGDRDVRVYVNLCRVDMGDHLAGNVPATMRQYEYVADGHGLTMRYKRELDEIRRNIKKYTEALERAKTQKDRDMYTGLLKTEHAKRETIKKLVVPAMGVADLTDSMSMLSVKDAKMSKKTKKTKKGKKTQKKTQKPSRFQRLRRSLTRALRRKGTGRRRSTRRRGKSKAH